MSEENNVTFVGGKAVEQTDSLDSNVEPDVMDDAKAAVREAMKKAAGDAASEAVESSKRAAKQDPYKPPGAKTEDDEDDGAPARGPDGKFLPKKEEKEDEEEEEFDPDKADLKRLFKNREKLAKKESAFQKQIASERQAFERERQQFQQQQVQFQQEMQKLQLERQKFEHFRKNPADAVRDMYGDPEQFIIDLAQDGTPEGKLARQQRELQRQIEEINVWKQQQFQREQEMAQERQYQQLSAHRQSVESQFLGYALAEERPFTSTLYKDNQGALVHFGDLVAAEYRQLSGGKEASLSEIADYIEDYLAERVDAVYKTRAAKKEPAVVQGKPPKAAKGKTLTPELSSERRAVGKNLDDLDNEERLEAAKEAVGLALAATR